MALETYPVALWRRGLRSQSLGKRRFCREPPGRARVLLCGHYRSSEIGREHDCIARLGSINRSYHPARQAILEGEIGTYLVHTNYRYLAACVDRGCGCRSCQET